MISKYFRFGGTKMMRTVHTQFNEKNLTGNAGLVHAGRFIDKLGLDKILERRIAIKRGANSEYSISEVILILTLGVIAGVKHMSHLVIIRNDTVLRKIFNWTKFPVDTTFSRIFKLFSHKHCNQLSDVESQARNKVWEKKWRGKATLDLDSSVKGVFGSQEGAAKGYNPKKKGQKSFHPLFCFIAETCECLHNWFRTGSAYSANGCVEFMKECFAKLPKRVWKIVVRADSAFFNGSLLDLIEHHRGEYIVKVGMRGLASLLERQVWRKIGNRPDFESTVFHHKCEGWNRQRKFVAVRMVTLTPSEDPLFPGMKVEYEYFCYVTDMNLSPYAAHKFYGKRATSENWIEWCKNHMASGSILTDHFWANSAIFQTCILAYNIKVWMMWLTFKDGLRQEPNTIRRWLINVPARLNHRGRQWFLKLSKSYPFKEHWRRLEDSTAAFCLS